MPTTDSPAPLLLTITQAASVLGISRTTVYELLKDGELHAIHIRRSSRISQDELARFVRERDRARTVPARQRRRRAGQIGLFEVGDIHNLTREPCRVPARDPR